MGETKRLSDRNKLIQEMLTDGKSLMNFYRFVAQNPHINLHDACQIVINRPNVSVCYLFSEWNEMERRVIKSRKGVPYYDENGNKRFVFDRNDTWEKEYKRSIYPMGRLLKGLQSLTGADFSEVQGDYWKIKVGVVDYLTQNEMFSDEDEDRNRSLIDGIAYSLYCKTGFPKNLGITFYGMPYSLYANADLFKEIVANTETLLSEIEEAYEQPMQEKPLVDDTEEETISDEPILPTQEPKERETVFPIKTRPNNALYDLYMGAQEEYPNAVVIIRLGDFYEIMGDNAKVISDELDLTLTGRDVGLEERVPMVGFPYHAADRYLEKILENHSVVLVEQGEEAKYILSYEEARKEREKPRLIELSEEESAKLGNVFDEEERADEEVETYDGDIPDEYDVEYTADHDGEIEEIEDDSEDYDGEDEEIEEKPQPKEKKGKPIQERKRKEKP